VSLPGTSASAHTPGLLPFPDRRRDGNYDGKSDCVTFGLNESHLLGRLPVLGEAKPCPSVLLGIDIRDGAGERLWYAVSRNLILRRGRGSINPGLGDPGSAAYSWIRVRDRRGDVVTDSGRGEPLVLAAVLIAPGTAVNGQNRSKTAPGAAEFLDSVSIGGITFSNSDSDGCQDAVPAPCGTRSLGEEFIAVPDAPVGSGFNDQVAYITVAELMRAVEKRVLGEVAVALYRYRDAFGAYPWLAEFRDPPGAPFGGALRRRGFLPVHLPAGTFSTRFGSSWRFVDSTPTTTHAGDARLVPQLRDLMSGSVQLAKVSGRCVWSDWTHGDCGGSLVIPTYFRADLGVAVRRTVEIAFHIADHSPQVHPPTSTDVRRRTLSVTSGALPMSPSRSWSVRITDDDGINQGRRDIAIDGNTGGEITLSGIRYDLSVAYDGKDDRRDELPEWFIENDWHHFIHAAFSADAVAGGNGDGDDDCTTPVDDCLTLMAAGRPVSMRVRALVISTGPALARQDRSIGDCDGDGIADDFLCAWLEGDNSDTSTPVLADTYVRGEFSRHFNDQVRIVDPPP